MKKIITALGLCYALIQLATAGQITLLTDNFNATSIDTSKWTIIKATGHQTFDEDSEGTDVTPLSSLYMYITHDIIDSGGAYKSKLLPINAYGGITIERRSYNHYANQLVSMPDELVSENGTVLMR